MRVLICGAGVIGSAYAARLLGVGNDVTLLARGTRFSALRADGLVVDEPLVETRSVFDVRAIDEITATDRFELVVVAVRPEQLLGTLPMLSGMVDDSDVLFLGDLAPHQSALIEALGARALFGFPSVSGVREGATTRFAQIDRVKTVLSEPSGEMSVRVRNIQTEFSIAGFPTVITTNFLNWMRARDAFMVPIDCALHRVGGDPVRLSEDDDTLRLMIAATREAFTVLHDHGNADIAADLRLIYRRVPTAVDLAHWHRVLRDQRGELWFGAHARTTVGELRSRISRLKAALGDHSGATPALDQLVYTVGQGRLVG
ncbi:ketopantoate reductase family protein [Lacisediminihabitans sp. FW035]